MATLLRGAGMPIVALPAARRGSPLRRSVSAELFKLVRRPATWTLSGLVALVLVVVTDVVGLLSLRSAGADDPDRLALRDMLLFENLSSSALGIVVMVGGPIVLILGALISGSEYGWTTLTTVLTQGPRRLDVLGGKAAALAVLVAALVAVGWVATAVGSLAVSAVEGTPVDLPSLGNLLGGLGGGWLVAMVWGTAGLALGVIFRSTTVPIGLGLIWGLAAEALVSGLSGSIAVFDAVEDYLIGPNGSTLANAVRPSFFTSDDATTSTTHALVVLTGYIVVLATAAGYLFRTRDLT